MINTKNLTSAGTMLLITSAWDKRNSFKMIPIDNNCPFVECIYDPDSHILVILHKTMKSSFHMVPKLDTHGDPKQLNTRRHNGKDYSEERVTVDTFQEYYILDKSEIQEFVFFMAVNANEFNYQKHMVEPLPVVDKPADIPEVENITLEPHI